MQRLRGKILELFVALLLPAAASCQDFYHADARYGIRAGAIMAFGTHVQRLGLTVNFYYIRNAFQANSEIRLYYNFRNLGPPLHYAELVLSQGLLFGYGQSDSVSNPFISSVSNQTRLRNCIAYSYNAYLNRVRTTQQTGIVHLGFGTFSFLTENDILAKPALDRFRSGAFLLQYRHEGILEAGLNCSIWTGHYKRKADISGIRAFYNDCYMDTSGGTYTSYSHGLLVLQAKCLLPHYQYLQATGGVDAEQVRDAIQNRVTHNMRFVPRKLNKARNCHLPMLDDKGGQYLYREQQRVRKPRPCLELWTNPNIFY